MSVKITAVHFKTDHKLDEFVNNKVEKLNNYFDGIVSSEVILKVLNTDKSENKIAEIKLNLKGEILYAEKSCATFEEAVDLVCEALQKQLVKHKEKLRSK